MTSGRGRDDPGALYSRASVMLFRDDSRKTLRLAGFAIWAAVGLPVLLLQLLSPESPGLPAAAWAASFLLFGAAFARATGAPARRSDRPAIAALIAGQTAAVLAMIALPPCFGLEGALLVVVALELGGFLPPRPARVWITLQSAAMLAVVWLHWSWHWGVVLAAAYLPFQLVADRLARLLAEESAARERLLAVNAELRATRELLAQNAREAERARIARDMHDVLGHHLTALSLNLEIARHLSGGDARARVEAAQSITRLLLGDVRGAVAEMREPAGLDLPAALRELASGIPSPRIHVAVGPDVAVEDAADGEAVFRCVQEIVTNAVRHAGAENLWLDVERGAEALEIRARDDGRGADAVRTGHGLSGMRERFEARGGSLSIETAPGRGFSVRAVLPMPGTP